MLFLLILLLLTTSCSFFVDQFDDGPGLRVHGFSQQTLSMAFSHNINGETHPCGCRRFPLGGLPQVAGKMEEIRKQSELIYVDTGDTFFPSTVIPKILRNSLTFAAKNLAKGLEQLGLHYFVPGDQDFAAGMPFLQELSRNAKFTFLIANLKGDSASLFKHKKWVNISQGPHRIFLIGLVSPKILPPQYGTHFTPMEKALKEMLSEIKAEGHIPGHPFHRLVVLTHAQLEDDKSLATRFNQIDWIIGAHTQSFTRKPLKKHNSRLVQVLSRNHYLGEIRFSLRGPKTEDSFNMHEIHDKLKDNLRPNPFLAFIDAHKEKLKEIRREEQLAMLVSPSDHQQIKDPLATAESCMECHEAQGRYWQGTPHALAYLTLIKANEDTNLRCLKCHTLGLEQARGFQRASDLVRFQKNSRLGSVDANVDANADYWQAFGKRIRGQLQGGDVRGQPRDIIAKISKSWFLYDEKRSVTHNFANVQCLNCHTKSSEHPFEAFPIKAGPQNQERKMRMSMIRQKCLLCHDRDQSPEWYHKDSRGLPGKLDGKKLTKIIKGVACPLQDSEEVK